MVEFLETYKIRVFSEKLYFEKRNAIFENWWKAATF